MTEQERAKASEEAYEKLRQELDSRLKADRRLAEIAEKIKSGRAGFHDTAEYSEIVSGHLAQVIQDGIGRISNPSGLQMVCESLLKDHYEAINAVLGQVQAVLDEQCGIHIRPQKAKFPEERVRTVAHSLLDPTVPAATIRRRAGAPVENTAKSMHDDYMKENAKFRSDAGLECYITRSTDGKCCAWCTSMAGRYLYGTEPQDVYRRHDNCGCTVIYENGRQRQNVWTKKSWDVKDTPKKSGKPVRLDYKQAKELERRNLSQFRGLTSGAFSDTMEVKRSGIIIKTGLYSGEVLHYPIVPERISHIQDLHISGLSDDCNIALTQGCRDLLDYMKDSELGTEGILVFSMDLKELDRYKASSSVSSVPFQSRTEKVVVIHNHPSDMLFSDTDLFRLYERDEIQILGAVGHNGSTYFAEKTDQYDAFGFWDFLEECKMDFPIKMSHEDRVKYVEKVMGGAEEYGVKFYTSIYKESD